MFEFGARLRQAIEELTGNESLLQMLDTDPARELLEWGVQLATSVVRSTQELARTDPEEALQARLKAVRRIMRTVGNWAAGQYADPASREQLKDALLENFRTILGDDARLPSGEQVAATLNEVDQADKSPRQLILRLKQLFEKSS